MTVALLGYGKFGQALGGLLDEAGLAYRALDPSAAVPEPRRAATLEALLEGAEQVVLAVPVPAIREALVALAPHLGPEQLVLDVGSVKVGPARAMAEVLGERLWAPTHPLFGPTSLAHGERPLQVIVCSHPRARADAQGRARRFYERLGCRVLELGAEEHDRLMAETHALTYFVAKGFLDLGIEPAAEFAPPSFRAMARTIEAVRSDAGHLFAAIHRQNPFTAGVRARLLEALQAVHRRLEEGSDEDEVAVPPPVVAPTSTRAGAELDEARRLIDEVDRELLELLARRGRLAVRALEAKTALGRGVKDAERERQLLARRRDWGREAGLDDELVDELYEVILRHSRRLQEQQRGAPPLASE